MPVFIGQRDDSFATTSGHVVGFKAGQETFIPDDKAVMKQCIERGHQPKKDEPVKAAEPKVAPKVADK